MRPKSSSASLTSSLLAPKLSVRGIDRGGLWHGWGTSASPKSSSTLVRSRTAPIHFPPSSAEPAPPMRGGYIPDLRKTRLAFAVEHAVAADLVAAEASA